MPRTKPSSATTMFGADRRAHPSNGSRRRAIFFKLSAYQDKLLALYDDQPDFIGPDSRRNEVVSFVKADCATCRFHEPQFDWGVKVPGDPEHVM